MKKIEDEYQWEIHQIQRQLEKLDQTLPVNTPELEWFEQEIKSARAAIKKKFMQEIFVFLIVAIVSVSLLILLLYQKPMIYFGFQVVVLLAMIGYFYMNRKKQVNER